MTYSELLEACHKPFPWWSHQFISGNIYVKIQDTVIRLNSLGVPWDLHQGEPVVTINPKATSSGKAQYDAVTSVQLHIEGLGNRGATGGATNFDIDTAVKSAHSYAVRKAASLFGVAHYLMLRPEENAAFVNHMTSADMGNLQTLKRSVILMADADGVNPTADDITAAYGIAKADLGSVEGILKLLNREGRI